MSDPHDPTDRARRQTRKRTAARVTKASLYNTFDSKDGLVRAYLEQRMRRRQERIARILAANDTPRERILGVFAEVEGLLAGSQFRGCRFISAPAEARPGDASELVAAQYRAWLWSLFTDLAETAGCRWGLALRRGGVAGRRFVSLRTYATAQLHFHEVRRKMQP